MKESTHQLLLQTLRKGVYLDDGYGQAPSYLRLSVDAFLKNGLMSDSALLYKQAFMAMW